MHLIKFEFSEVSLLIFTKIDSERQPINDEKRKKRYQPQRLMFDVLLNRTAFLVCLNGVMNHSHKLLAV